MNASIRRLLCCGLICLIPVLVQGSGSYGSRAPRTKSSKDGAVPTGERTLLNVDRKGVALQGYDPVVLFKDGRAVKGDPQYRAEYGGAIYHFSSGSHQEAFQANPGTYAPQFGGFCAMGVAMGKLLKVDVSASQVVEGRLLMQKNAKARDMFHQDEVGNLRMAESKWPGLVEKKGR